MNNIYELQFDHPLFRYFTPEERSRIEALAKVFTLEEGGLLIDEGEDDSTLFAVDEGRLDVLINRKSAPQVIASVGPGDVIGEVSFIDDSPRTVSVVAAEETRVRAWNKTTLTETLAKEPVLLAKLAIALNELLVERLRLSVRRQGMVRPV
jgi:CRP-like cAMP-binding protein